MSHNQSRAERSDSFQYRKSGRSGSSGQPRNFSGGSGKGSGGTAPPPSSLTSNRSFKKPNNAQGGQSRVSGATVNSDSSNAPAAARTLQNGSHVQPPVQGAADAPVSGITVKPTTDIATQKNARAVPKAPSSQPTIVNADTTAPATPTKGEASKSFPLQFGSISSGFMNGMQIPARTNSALPNLDEQKRDQARHDSSRATPMFPIPAVPKQQTTRKDVGVADQSNTGEAHQMSKARWDAQIMSALPVTQTQKASVHPIPGVSMPMPFHHPQAPVQFGMGPQLPPQLGNLGISISLQFTQQQAGKFGATRIPVKITHPGTHEELRLDRRADMYRHVGPSGPRSRPTVPKSQPLTSVPPPHPINYYPNSYNPNSLYFSGPSSVPLAGNQINPSSQAPIFSYPVSQGPHTAVSFVTPSAHNSYSNNYSSLMHGFAEPSSLELPRDVPNATSSAPSPSVQVTVMHSYATGFQKGLIPSPQTPLAVIHKAEKKYEVGQVTDQEEAKQRQLKAILNKLMPQNFEKIFEQVKAVNIDNAVTLTGVILQIFDKALMDPTFCEMYANLCYHLARALPDFSEDNEKITFRRLLLNKCQEEFERDARKQEEADRADQEGEVKQSEQEREEKRIKARRRMLGNIRLIGELYKKKMLTERIMHERIKKLLGQYPNPDEEDIEALCKLMSTIGEMIDHPKAKKHMDAYFDMMAKLSNNMKLSSRLRFMLKDSTDLRKNKWQQRRKVEAVKSYSQQAEAVKSYSRQANAAKL